MPLPHLNRSFWPKDDDWSMNMRATWFLDMPKRFNLLLHLPWEKRLCPIFEQRTERMLRKIAAGEDMPFRKLVRTIEDAKRETINAAETVDKMIELFNTMAFTRAQIETMPDGYRKELIVQRRRKASARWWPISWRI